jgi:hypothetical protein
MTGLKAKNKQAAQLGRLFVFYAAPSARTREPQSSSM